jgi:hypothetical protein
MTPASSPYKEILWFTRYVDSKPVQVIAEYHLEWVNGYVATALKNKTGGCKQARSAFV